MNDWNDRVTLLFSAGARPLKSAQELTLAELLLANRLPPSLFQAYEVPGDGSLKPIPMTLTLGQVPENRTVLLQCMRNTDIDGLRPAEIETVRHADEPTTALLDFDYADRNKNPQHRAHLVDDAAMREIVFGKIADFLADNEIPVPLVAGISGGGDSSSLVQGVRRYTAEHNLDASAVTCFTLVMEPLWPESAAQRARALCAEAGFEHVVLYPDDAAALLDMGESPRALWAQFKQQYGADSSHFFGTFFVNLAGRALCAQRGAGHLLVGYQREDVMAELLFLLMNGRRPLPFPRRRTGEVDVLMPVWDVPKSLLDACYPSVSESNYAERVDSTAVRRSSIYYLAHCIDALVPQMSLSLMSGIKSLMEETEGWQDLSRVGTTPLLHTGHGRTPEQTAMIDLLMEHFPQWSSTTSGPQ
ncbi:asparagine synthase-related protein [Streptomonospora litoralis]|uniref:Asparagine synthetase domain-containing protein n=1 Tax=Streptomonospora litoralis TaxID=2498135 RepID=A0A4P6Q0M6_9ACTN|nr:asparagine synthase-related protein [Streptomonospora litoralis]QBI53983.1 hypothetical protein EKD16_10990 [Streptomonospora litoralis]